MGSMSMSKDQTQLTYFKIILRYVSMLWSKLDIFYLHGSMRALIYDDTRMNMKHYGIADF